jgi:hypothetical protein
LEAPSSLVEVLEEARELVCDSSGNVRDLLKDDNREATSTAIIYNIHLKWSLDNALRGDE